MAASKPYRPPGFDRLKRAIAGQHPLIYLVSWEEARTEGLLRALAGTAREPAPLRIWTSIEGLRVDGEVHSELAEPMAVLDAIVASTERGFWLLKDFPREWAAGAVQRKTRDAYRALRDKGKFVFFLSPRLELPEDLKKEVHVIELALPGEEEFVRLFSTMLDRYEARAAVDDELFRQVVQGLRGLTHDEAGHVLHKILSARGAGANLLDEVLAEKEQISRKEGVLEFVPPRWNLADVGGLENLKDWLLKRAKLLGPDARKAGIPMPKGVLLMGMSGCGKSLSVKAISSLWNLPLFRLDIARIFGGAGGNPELLFRRALETAQAVAPCILWIDEIEMGVAGYREGDGGVTSRLFSTFLTWMQEKEEFVFVAATANRIHLLPAEIIRKGRFDQVFFLDLPTEEDRKAIFAVHLRKVGVDPATFDVVFLAKSTKNWNGAEIEQCVAAAAVEAFSAKRKVEENDLYRGISGIVPLAVTMEEQMKAIKNWAHDRAIPASKVIR